ncbi:bestrophin family protein [Bradyrhizobium sp. U87765 SZCCT0131]|uniref:bestrophin family protein n=1 Tax=unclassified Bradyrhizobium TaxID=2631580 RepID=UPI001BAC3339|nr:MULTISPECIES: bestrophin family protein [unclassified Bradyrhizobium]MBR1221636.1 bestrophin family protein [Bradyrhizobium sp. U87765 SZCCT0131]MBR1264441.1 bestrophin family protein [Bradyrhizobium sp. U87765 SZCCT0134]MBR1304652.1 bestrophin family protein [Bradyrhizobium sp. U87765 SZCCT0110]MBR1322491.1 bestrophin family protein [Bradyrhizobium sp. U87765 SZCCT0109]MBR1346581.1 bestrophin family protein [Bradyrhizobium sp. U87765 SZCCT0048]
MIVRGRPSFRDVIFAVRGSILRRIVRPLLFMLVVSGVAVLLAQAHPLYFAGLAAMPFTLIGLSLSIFMSFRNTACYDRWWEGRKLWGQLIIASRSFSRQVATVEPSRRDPLLRGLCGFAAGLAARLRGSDEYAAIARHVGDGPWAGAPNPTDAVLAAVGRGCRELAGAGPTDAIHYSLLETQLNEMAHVQGGCERIKSTPLPFSYSLLLHRTAYAFCLLLPFALAPSLGWWTPLPTVLVCYAFFGLDALGDELSDPFGTEPNDLPLDAMVRTIERDLLHAMGRDLPPPLEARDYVLL